MLIQNAFSELLSDLGLDVFRILVPDVLHEFELGIWKAVFSHLVRILHSISESLVRELDRRYVISHGQRVPHSDDNCEVTARLRLLVRLPYGGSRATLVRCIKLELETMRIFFRCVVSDCFPFTLAQQSI